MKTIKRFFNWLMVAICASFVCPKCNGYRFVEYEANKHRCNACGKCIENKLRK